MARYARLENGIAIELIDTGEYAITQLYAPAFVEAMVQVPEGMHLEIGAPISELRHEVEPLPVMGSPVVIPVSVVEEQEPLAAARKWRHSTLSATEWRVTRHRDWPDSSQFPSAVSRPSAPEWLAADVG